MNDPAIDNPGVRLDDHLAASIEVLKAKDAAAVGQVIAPADIAPDTSISPVVFVPPTPTPAPAPVSAVKPIAKAAPIDAITLAIRKVQGAQSKLVARAERLAERADRFSAQVDTGFDRQEDSLARGEQAMDMLDASLAVVGNEDPNA